MKKNIFSKYLFGALALGMMASCSNELPVDDGKILPNETTTYVRLSLVGGGSNTRAEAEYEDGTSDENAVNTILLTFFDAGRNYVGKTTIEVNDDNIISEGPGNADITVEKILTVAAPVTLPENINYPRYVVAYVNPTTASDDLTVDKLEDVMKYIRHRNTISNKGRTMNNSIYFSENTGYVRFATEVNFTTQFFPTLEEARDASSDKAITITVERMEAKVRLSTDIAKIEPETLSQKDANNSDAEYTLDFVPEAWFVNGIEKRSFLIKNYRKERKNYFEGHATFPDSDFGMSLGALQNAFKNNNTTDTRWNEINREDFLRSFWAIDPTYFIEGTYDNLYPEVSYDVLYNENGTVINEGGAAYPLIYRSYENVVKEWNSRTDTKNVKFYPGGGIKSHEYVTENTMSYNTLTSPDALASMTSVVLVGHYIIKDKEGKEVFNGQTASTNQSFYVRHEGGNNMTMMLSDNEAIDFFLERGGSALFVQQVDQDGKPVENTYIPLRAGHLKDGRYGVSYADFQLVYPTKSITGGTVLSEQWRTLRLKKNNGAYNSKIYVYDASQDDGKGAYVNLTDDNISAYSPRFYSTFGVVERFNAGKAYFNVPLKHIWGAAKGSGKFDAKTVVLGDYGVVRNHIYDLTINKITGLGTGIGDPKQPIVPPTENDQYYISARLNILQWRLVKQSIDL